MISKYLIFRKFDNNFIVIDKLRKDVYFLEEEIFVTLKHGSYDNIEDPDGLIKNILDYLKINNSKFDIKSIKSNNYSSLDDAFYDINIPIFCTLETTNACNLKCAHCYHGSSLIVQVK